MKEQPDKHLDKLTERVFNDSALESPSHNFMDNVMAEIHELTRNKVTIYKPLISKNAWVLIFSVLVAVIFWIVYTDYTYGEFDLFNKLSLTEFSVSGIFKGLSSFKLSDRFMYPLILFGIMLSLQMSFLKRYYDRKFS